MWQKGVLVKEYKREACISENNVRYWRMTVCRWKTLRRNEWSETENMEQIKYADTYG